MQEKNQQEPKVHPNIYEFVSRDWDVCVSKAPHPQSDDTQKNSIDILNFRCGVCLHKNIKHIHGWGFGSMAGGAKWNEFKCLECGHYTFFEQEWG